jgi:hypothetical protein
MPSLRSEAGHRHVDECAQLAHQEVDVDARAAVHVGRELPGQDGNSHGFTLG